MTTTEKDKTVHFSPETRLPEIELAVELAGARPHFLVETSYSSRRRRRTSTSSQKKGTPGYITFNMDEMSEVREKHNDLIYGRTHEEIEQQLLEKFPVETGTRRIVCWYRAGTNGYKHSFWEILPYPMPTDLTPANAFSAIRGWIRNLGTPVLVAPAELSNRDNHELSDPDAWRSEGFGVREVDGRFLLSISSSARETIFKRETQRHQELMRGYFSFEAMTQLKKSMDPDSWPWLTKKEHEQNKDVPSLNGAIMLRTGWDSAYGPYTDDELKRRKKPRTRRSVDEKEQRLSDCRRRCSTMAAEILSLIDLARRVCAGYKENPHWYREHRVYRGYEAGDTRLIFEEMLPFLHGVEKFAAEAKDKTLQHFCRWVRKETRAAKLKIPPKPRPPQRPGRKRSV